MTPAVLYTGRCFNNTDKIPISNKIRKILREKVDFQFYLNFFLHSP